MTLTVHAVGAPEVTDEHGSYSPGPAPCGARGSYYSTDPEKVTCAVCRAATGHGVPDAITQVLTRYAEIVRSNGATCRVFCGIADQDSDDDLEIGAEIIETAYEMGFAVAGDSDWPDDDADRDAWLMTLRAQRWRLIDMLAEGYDPIGTEVVPTLTAYVEALAAGDPSDPIERQHWLALIAEVAKRAELYTLRVANL